MVEPGAYAAFVAPAYGVTALVFLAMAVGALRHAARWKARAKDLDRP
jgi:heme exporter protein CcmD